MKKVLKWVGGILAVLILLLFISFKVLQSQTKKNSPEQTVTYTQGDLDLSVFYNRPYKKGREIFGGLEPFGKVWRTGANEATTFTTNKDLSIGGQSLSAGKYTLWTIPEQDEWTVIFNNKQYGWGVDFNAQASRDPAADALQVKVPVEKLVNVVEQFTIAFEEGVPLKLTLAWDQTKVSVPLQD